MVDPLVEDAARFLRDEMRYELKRLEENLWRARENKTISVRHAKHVDADWILAEARKWGWSVPSKTKEGADGE